MRLIILISFLQVRQRYIPWGMVSVLLWTMKVFYPWYVLLSRVGTWSRTNSPLRVQRSWLEQVRNSTIVVSQLVASSVFGFQLQKQCFFISAVCFFLYHLVLAVYIIYVCFAGFLMINRAVRFMIFPNEKNRKSVTSITNRDLLSCVSPRWAALGVFLQRLGGVACFSSLGTGYIFSRACDRLHVFPHCLSSLRRIIHFIVLWVIFYPRFYFVVLDTSWWTKYCLLRCPTNVVCIGVWYNFVCFILSLKGLKSAYHLYCMKFFVQWNGFSSRKSSWVEEG